MKPLLLDLFCGAGGCTKGYQRAGFHVVGVDNRPMPRYCGEEFEQADAIEDFWRLIDHYEPDVIHASPPCQRYSGMSRCRPELAAAYPDLIPPMRDLLEAWGGVWAMENVKGAPLREDLILCGAMVGLPIYRHRVFESSVILLRVAHPPHVVPASRAGHWKPGTIISVSGNCSPIAHARAAMGCEWMSRAELAESIPPAYTELIGHQLMAHVRGTLASRTA